MKKFINEWTPKEFEDHILTVIGQRVTISTIEIAGDGNMNFTYRLVFDDGLSIIVKQSPPYCARFPDIIAPEERIFSEVTYYQLLAEDTCLSKHSPDLLGIDHDKKIAYISDLGQATDFEFLYSQQKKLDPKICEKIILYMAKLHSLAIPEETNFENLKMRELNHTYIFDLPFKSGDRPVDLDLITDGLAETVDLLMNDHALKTAAEQLGELYFENTHTLIHGDYYPMSWIETNKGLFVIDPEFGFLGLPEIDVGIFLAHMLLSNNFEMAYDLVGKKYGSYNDELVAKFCAVEVIRRISHVAQLPIINSLSFKKSLLEKSAEVLKTGNIQIYKTLNM